MTIELVEDGNNYRVKSDGRQIALFYVSGPIDEHYTISKLTFESNPDSSGLPEIIGVMHGENLAKGRAHLAAVKYFTNLEKMLFPASA